MNLVFELFLFCSVSDYLEKDGKWKIHPDWVYCEYNYGGTRDRLFDKPEDMMHHFLMRLDDVSFYCNNYGWKFGNIIFILEM